MRLRLALCVLASGFFSAFLFAAGGCYDQPPIPKGHPLTCRGNDAGNRLDCPKGYACIGQRVCAPTSCRTVEDCPLGTYCSTQGRGGCVLLTGDAGGDVVPIPLAPDDPSIPDGSRDVRITVPSDPGSPDGRVAVPTNPGTPDAGGTP